MLPYDESELLSGLNEYTSHANELARLDIETDWVKDESPETKH